MRKIEGMKRVSESQQHRCVFACTLITLMLGCGLLIGPGISVNAQTNSGRARMFVPEAWPRETGAPVNSSPVLGDLDQDGVLEIVVGTDNNKVYAWKPDGTLMPGWPVTTGDSVRSSPALADIDNDGRLDVIVGSFDNKVYVWNFNGSLLAGWPVVTGSVVYSSPAVGDIDGDQQPEVIVGSFDNKVYAWNADGTLVRGWPKPTGLFVYSSPALADLDRDGMLEVIVGTDNNRVFAWNGDGTDLEGWPTATEHVVPSSPAVGDIDNDGELEVVVGSWDQIFVWNSRGERKPGWPVTAGHQIPSSPALADLDRDGQLDIIAGCKDGRVYAWNANGQLLPGWPAITDAEITASPAVADLNGDGVLEVVIGSKDSKIYVWDAEGRLLPGWPKSTGGAISSSPAIGDVDGDGTLELVVGSKDNRVYAWNFERTGAFAPRVVWGNFHGDQAHSGIYQMLPQQGGYTGPIQTTSMQPAPPGAPGEGSRSVPAISPGVVVPREIREGAINNLVISDYTDTQVTLTWTAPTGIRTPQTVYDIRYSPTAITEGNWNQAAQFPAVLLPASAGTREVYALSNLPRADVLYFAIRVSDGQNLYPISNVVQLERVDTVPPARITGLTVSELSSEVLQLSWTTTGDDGNAGLVATYDIRYSEAPLNELTWLRAIQIEDEPAPLPAGAEQTFQLRKPWTDREIYFGIKAIDEALNISELSEVVVWSPQDDRPPARIADMRITAVNGDQATLAWTAPGDDQMTGKAMRYDIRYSEYPLTEANWAAASPVQNPPAPAISGTQQTYTLAGIMTGLVGYVGIKAIDGSGNVSPLSNVVEPANVDFIPPEAITDLRIEESGRDWVRVSWTATGDDGQTGMAAAYSLRYGGNLRVVQSWTTAVEALDVPPPSGAGTRETATISGLDENSTYYVALRALDGQGNMSEMSNVLRVKTLGRSTPETIKDLAIEAYTSNGLTLNWTAPQDQGEETATVAGYDVRFLRTELTESTWETATKIPAPRTPSVPGSLETSTLKGLPQDTAYYVGIKSYDALGNPSALSNVLAVPELDTVAPAAVVDLFVEDAGPNSVTLSWTATGDDNEQGQATSYQIRVGSTLNELKQWDDARDISTFDLLPSAAGMSERFTINGLESKSTFYAAIKALDEFGNASELSNIVRAKTKDADPPATIMDLKVVDLQEDSLILEWTAPGEDGMQGQATAYDVRYSSLPITDNTWSTAQMIPLVPKPSPAGSIERMTINDLAPDTLYYFAVVAIDGSDNQSPLSNVVDVLTIDTIPPPPISSLRVKNVDDSGVLLTWLSPGDDAYRDVPEQYEIRYIKGQDTTLDEASWNTAEQVREAPIPSVKGEQEEFLLSGLERNAWYTIGVKAIDEYGNAPEISNVVRVYTSASRIDDLAILDFSGQSVTLTWTAPGGDLSEGERRYDIRYATTPITDENWAAASVASTLLPQDLTVEEPTSTEKVEVTGLPPYEQVFLAVKVVRQTPERRTSPLSNVVELNRIDIISPGEPVNLQVADLGDASEGTRTLDLSWRAPGDNDNEGTATRYELRYGTLPPNEENWESLTPVMDLPDPQEAGTAQKTVIQIRPQEDTLYFALRAYDEALNVGGLSNVAHWSPEDFISPAAVADLRVEEVHGGDITLSWTAPGDNEHRGIAAFYDIRYATKEAEIKKWDSALVVAEEPLPEPVGTLQEYTITGLQQDTMYYIALKTTDDAKNTSEVSNIVTVRSGDEVPPASIGDLRVDRAGDDWVELVWTASGDDGNSGRATSYSLRYSDQRDGLADWETAYEVVDIQAPSNPGKEERVRVQDLHSNTTYYFGLQVIDNGGNVSEISNIAQSLTSDGESSKPIHDLVFVGGTDTSVTLSWTAPRDRGPVGRIARYEIRYSEDRDQISEWNRARQVKQAIIPGEPDSMESIVIENLSIDGVYYVAIRAIDQLGNVSEISNIAKAYTTDTVAPRPVADLVMESATEHSVTVAWTIVEDDAKHDVPDVYEVRYDLEPISAVNWETAELVSPSDRALLQPTAPGLAMTCTIEALAENTTYFVAVRALDASGNASPVSNVLTVRTQDLTSPEAVTDLQAVFPTANGVMLKWTSPSDVPSLLGSEYSGTGVTTKTYDIRYTTEVPENGVLDEKVWEAAERVLVPPPPQAPGTPEEFVVRNLLPGTTYYLALRAIDQSDNVSAVSNTVVEATLPFDDAVAVLSGVGTRGMTATEYTWELKQGQALGQLRREGAGTYMLTTTGATRGLSQDAVLTAVYPQSNQTMEVQQGTLSVQVKTPQRFSLYLQVQADTGETYYLGYTTDFGMLDAGNMSDADNMPDAEEPSDEADMLAENTRRLTPVEKRPKARIENYVFFPIDPKVLDNEWHTLNLDLTRDLFEGAGVQYNAATRLAVRGNSLTFREMRMQGPVFTKIDDFQTLQSPFENGWKLHFGSGVVEIGREAGLPDVQEGNQGSSVITSIGIVPMADQENLFLTAKADNQRGLVLTYPKDSFELLSDKPYFLANVRATGDFKIILKVSTTDHQEYYVAYVPESQLQQTGLSGDYLYVPLSVVADERFSERWLTVQANIADDLKRHQLDYAYTSWMSFHGSNFSLDNIRFSTAVLETIIQ